MRTCLLVVASLGALGLSVHAQMTEHFDYADGPLTAVSSGAWELWDPANSGDNTVVSNALVLTLDGDNNRFFTDIFSPDNDFGSVCFSATVSAGNTDQDDWIYFGPGSSPGVTGISYAEGVIFALDVVVGDGSGGTLPPDPGKLWVAAWDLAENRFFAYGQVTEADPHHYYVYILGRNQASNRVDYAFLVDGVQMFQEHFTASSVTAVEVYPTGQSTATATFDDIVVIGNGDTNFDCCVDDADLTNVILDFGAAPSGNNGGTDLNGDGIVDDADLTLVILGFGQGC